MSLCPEGTLRRSASSALPASSDSVYVADSIGEMGLWYSLAPVAMMGGSWAKVGGHNPYEPLALACNVIHGPHVWNFSESYGELDARGLSQIAIDDADIVKAVSAAWAQDTTHTLDHQKQATELLQNLIRLVNT
jgi:3-deoxy-D-manno-octulosonic-acid transferase